MLLDRTAQDADDLGADSVLPGYHCLHLLAHEHLVNDVDLLVNSQWRSLA